MLGIKTDGSETFVTAAKVHGARFRGNEQCRSQSRVVLSMKNKLVMTVAVNAGRCVWSDTQLAVVREFLGTFPDGRAVTVTWAKPKSTRSLKANAYLWVIYTYIADHTGMDTESVHEFAKDSFLPRRFITLGGKEKEIRKTTTELTPAEMSAYTEKVIAWAGTELGVAIPSMGEF